ncbi:protein lethal(2)essential for life-like [Ctenocephalides felis]|uniref:protein lethal(2)essential for life-like n=1 Tax=Ctenocephalides felis TaxID=7515 RepID=UPI000E6E3DD7|nr:protein lethal(2)essential for life-like [Ctenocephalides felis]
MSLVPFWRMMRMMDHHFNSMALRHDFFTPLSATSVFRDNFFKSWDNEISVKDVASSVTTDKDKFQITLDVQQFKPKEITVKTKNNCVIVEGKHEEKQDEHGFVTRHFVRRFMLPQNHEASDVVSNLSSDGVLTITAPKRVLPEDENERVVPITQMENKEAIKN